MLTPKESIELNKLQKKKSSYKPLSEIDFENITEQTTVLWSECANGLPFLLAPWNKYTELLQGIVGINTRLILEIVYLKEQLKKKEKS